MNASLLQTRLPFAPAPSKLPHRWDSLSPLHRRVFRVLRVAASREQWLTVEEVAEQVRGYSATTISARMRDLRKPFYGMNVLKRRHRKGVANVFEYLLSTSPDGMKVFSKCTTSS
jgi:hypothetical protein